MEDNLMENIAFQTCNYTEMLGITDYHITKENMTASEGNPTSLAKDDSNL